MRSNLKTELGRVGAHQLVDAVRRDRVAELVVVNAWVPGCSGRYRVLPPLPATLRCAEQARKLLDSIDTSTVVGLRDRALISVMTFAFARIGAVVAMRVEDYYPQGKRWWVRLHEKATVLTVKRRFAF